MALLTFRPPVNYGEQQSKFEALITQQILTRPDAFEIFLKTFKSSAPSDATSALQNLNIDEDVNSEDYDFLDDMSDGPENERRRMEQRHPKLKYLELLQRVANRREQHVIVELDDLEEVRKAMTIL